MSNKPTPPPAGSGKDIYSELAQHRCPFCHIELTNKVADQWLRSYDGKELWLTNVKSSVCGKCGTTVYPEESLQYFERARNGEIPNLKTRTYVPDKYDDNA